MCTVFRKEVVPLLCVEKNRFLFCVFEKKQDLNFSREGELSVV